MRWLIRIPITGILLLLPNLTWLWTSTVKISNDSDAPIDAVEFRACGKTRSIGRLGPGHSAFRLLPSCGDDTLDILAGGSLICRLYVEGELYHVDASLEPDLKPDDGSACSYDDPISTLFLAKALW